MAPRTLHLLGCLLLLLGLAGCAPTHTLTLGGQAQATAWTRTLDEDPLRQTLTIPAGTNEIELVLALSGTSSTLVTRPLTWSIRDNALAVVREGVLETAGYLHNTPLHLRFEPLPELQNAELVLTAPPEAELALWTSSQDQYASGTLLDSKINQNVDLHFTLRGEENPLALFHTLRKRAGPWQGVALWIPLMLVGPGWLVGWLLGSKEGRPITPLVAALSLSLAPLVYLWSGLLHLRLYEPLMQSLFYSSGLALAWLMLRDLSRVQRAWRTPWRGALGVLGVVILLGVVTWLLAGRSFLAPPAETALESGLLAQDLVRDGNVLRFSAPLPPAVLTATLTQLSRQPVTLMLLLAGLILGVATIPALYGLAAELALHPWGALWVLPLAWLWPTPWQAMGRGDLPALYSMALMPGAMALGLRALRASRPAWPPLLLAALPLAAVALVQGSLALLLWFLTLLLAAGMIWLQRTAAPPEPGVVLTFLLRAIQWLLLAVLLLLPGWFRGVPLTPIVPLAQAGYDWLLAIIVVASAVGWLARRPIQGKRAVTALVLLSLPILLWWRSAPLPTTPLSLTESDITVLSWADTGIRPDALFLINLRIEEGEAHATDSGLWSPMYAQRPTVLQRNLPVALLERAMQEDGLADPDLRQALQEAGVTHIYLGGTPSPLTPQDLLAQPWSRLAQQSGPAYLFELLPPITP